MPARDNNARNNQVQLSPRPSFPTQLPTPLPEEEHPSQPVVLDDRLIDFDTPTPPPQRPIHLPSTLDIDPLFEDDILVQTYRSPPFREAHLPDIESDHQDHSPPPLPVPPRGTGYQQEEVDDDHHHGGDLDASVTSNSGGHTRWPTYSR